MSFRLNCMYGHICETKLRSKLRKNAKLMAEFKALCNTVPQNEAQAQRIFAAIDRFVEAHPELQPQMESFLKEQREDLEDCAPSIKETNL